MDAVVDNNGALEGSAQRIQVLKVLTVGKSAMLTIQAVSKVLVVGVEFSNHCFRVLLLNLK